MWYVVQRLLCLYRHIFEMFDDANMTSWLYSFFHTALLNDFSSFALCMSDTLFDSANSSPASPSLSVEVYAQSVLWLLRSPVTVENMFLLPIGGRRYCSAGGLYTECCTSPGRSTLINSTLSSSLLTFRQSLM